MFVRVAEKTWPDMARKRHDQGGSVRYRRYIGRQQRPPHRGVDAGVPGCGPKTACEAARAGFGADLCKIAKRDRESIAIWKERLCHELKTNESKHFKQKHKALVIPEDFPRSDILGYYVRPVVSTDEKVERLRATLKWDQDIDVFALRTFCAEAFDWTCISGAKKFVRNLAPALLVKSLRLYSDEQQPEDPHCVCFGRADRKR